MGPIRPGGSPDHHGPKLPVLPLFLRPEVHHQKEQQDDHCSRKDIDQKVCATGLSGDYGRSGSRHEGWGEGSQRMLEFGGTEYILHYNGHWFHVHLILKIDALLLASFTEKTIPPYNL
jgi:hypothetical protein